VLSVSILILAVAQLPPPTTSILFFGVCINKMSRRVYPAGQI
jgi:hypothetical protein